jgi:uncharacterized protein
MPGSTTIGHTHPTVTFSHEDAARLAVLLERLSSMLETADPEHLTEAQVSALCEGQAGDRAEFADWTLQLTRQIRAHL